MNSIRRPFSRKQFQELFSQTPRLCLDLVIRIDQGVLLTQRSIEPLKDIWHLPGGTVLFNETLEQAVQGISKEELGIEVQIIKELGHIEFLNEDRNGWYSHSVSIAFLCTPNQESIKLNSEASEFDIFEQLPNKINPEHHSFLTKNWSKIMT